MEDLVQARAIASTEEPLAVRWKIPNPLAGIVFDFDGVMTDDRVLVREDGVEAVFCHRGDGLGIERARNAGLNLIVLSKETNPVVAARCAKLGIRCLQGCNDKLGSFRAIAKEAGAAPGQFIYLGNDINDLDCIRAAGLSVAVADANPVVLVEADLVLTKRGGHGAVRQLLDGVLRYIDGVTASSSTK
jgi:N-acylneuraminate cytidylyltransferase